VTNPMSEHWKVTVDRDACLGSGVCAGAAPRHFRLDAGRSRPIREDIEPDDIVLDVADTCPAEAITVYDDTGHHLAPDPT
jgi:ferredoxin